MGNAERTVLLRHTCKATMKNSKESTGSGVRIELLIPLFPTIWHPTSIINGL